MAEPRIDWAYSGPPNPMVGTGATRFEEALTWFAGLAGAGLTLFLADNGWVPWPLWQTAIAAIIAFDLIGGAVALQLNSAKRFYHAPLRPEEQGIVAWMKSGTFFPLMHVHPIVIYMVWRPMDVMEGIAIYGGINAAVIIVRFVPTYLSRPVATLFVVVAILANAYLMRPIPGFDWLLPVMALKLILGHAVREEPYRPN